MTWAPTARLPFPQSIGSRGVTAPRSSAPAMEKVFIVEPGSNASASARLRISLALRGAFGLWGGQLASASTSPVRASSATPIPPAARAPSAARAVAQRRDPRGRAGEEVVRGELDALEPVPVVADDAEELAREVDPRVIPAGLDDERDPAELVVLHDPLDRLRLGWRDAAREEDEPGRLRELPPDGAELEAERARDLRERRARAVLLREDRGVRVDRAGVGAAREEDAGAIGDRTSPRLQDELAPVLLDHVVDELVPAEHLQVEHARGDGAEAEREQGRDHPDADDDPAEGAGVGPGAHALPPAGAARPARSGPRKATTPPESAAGPA